MRRHGQAVTYRFGIVTPQRPQPAGQLHARRNHSTLLVLGGGS